jgi:hypothetical protein
MKNLGVVVDTYHPSYRRGTVMVQAVLCKKGDPISERSRAGKAGGMA